MASGRGYYFIRVNGVSGHTDPTNADCYVPEEPVPKLTKHFNYADYCLRQGVVRIGWPDVGDLRAAPKTGALCRCYDLDTIDPHVRQYLEQFRNIALGSVVLMPDKDRSGTLFIGDVTSGYDYFHRPPEHPYECAHRIGVRWDRHPDGSPVEYDANELGIGTSGGFWTRAFFRTNATQKPDLARRVDTPCRSSVGTGVAVAEALAADLTTCSPRGRCGPSPADTCIRCGRQG